MKYRSFINKKLYEKINLITSSGFVVYDSGVKLYSSLTKTEKSKLVWNESLKSVLLGLFLGDAHINQRSLTGNCRLLYGQSALQVQHVS